MANATLEDTTSTTQTTAKSPGAAPYVFQVYAPASIGSSAAAAIQSDSNEASIRFCNANDQVPWHVGSGGGAGAGQFFIWGGTGESGLIVTITPQGAMTISNGLTVAGGEVFLSAAQLLLPNMPPASNWSGAPLHQLMIDPGSGQVFYQ